MLPYPLRCEPGPRSRIPEEHTLMAQASRLLVNTGTGKGKSSAAFGVMGRAWARGWSVCVVQFVKSEKWRGGGGKRAGAPRTQVAHLGAGVPSAASATGPSGPTAS